MTGTQILAKFENYISDQLDQDFEIQLANDAKNSVESELELEVTKSLDATGTTTAGQTYTVQRNLPADFYLPLVIYVGSTPCYPVPFERQQDYRDTSGSYWIDIASGYYYLSGTQGSSETIYFYYQKETPDLTGATLSSWSPVWPDRFHSIIPLEMARIYWQIDQGEKNRAWTAEWDNDYQRMKSLLATYDARLKLNALGGSVSPRGTSDSENRINL